MNCFSSYPVAQPQFSDESQNYSITSRKPFKLQRLYPKVPALVVNILYLVSISISSLAVIARSVRYNQRKNDCNQHLHNLRYYEFYDQFFSVHVSLPTVELQTLEKSTPRTDIVAGASIYFSDLQHNVTRNFYLARRGNECALSGHASRSNTAGNPMKTV